MISKIEKRPYGNKRTSHRIGAAHGFAENELSMQVSEKLFLEIQKKDCRKRKNHILKF